MLSTPTQPQRLVHILWGLVTITYSGNTPILGRFVSIKPPQIILMAGMAGLVRATIKQRGLALLAAQTLGRAAQAALLGKLAPLALLVITVMAQRETLLVKQAKA